MRDDFARPQINASKLIVGGGFLGAIFAVGSAAIFLVGIPILRVMLPAAIVLGLGIALAFRFKRHKTPGAPWLLAATEGPKDSIVVRGSASGPRTLRKQSYCAQT